MSNSEQSATSISAPVSGVRAFAGGFLMGLANLVPGLSGGTMILVLGLYRRFIDAIAAVTSLRLKGNHMAFLAIFGVGGVVAVLGLSRVAMWAVVNHRMLSFALFVGLTLGVVPELLRLTGKLRTATFLAAALGFAAVVGLDYIGASRVAVNPLSLGVVGAIAAASMILPGLSGSYILLIFGMYEVVIGSLSLLSESPGEALGVLIPVGIGVGAGIALLSNLLKFLLARYAGPTHGALLGLVFGSVVGLWPFQELEHPELAERNTRKGIELVVLEDASAEQVNAERGLDWTLERVAEVRARYAGMDRGELKLMSRAASRFTPDWTQALTALALAALGFGIVRAISRTTPKAEHE